MPSSDVRSLFDECVTDIDVTYKRLGHTLGWRFLSVSRSVLEQPSKIALITLNPAGNAIPPEHPWASCEEGSSYLVESWNGLYPGTSTLQTQVRKMFAALHAALGMNGNSDDLLEQSLISHLIPFRSPRFADLHHKKESVAFGQRLWTILLPHVRPNLIICLGRDAQRELRVLIPAALGAKYRASKSYRTGWGEYTADIDTFSGSHEEVRLLFLPHLSTWTLFTSSKCVVEMPVIIAAAIQGLQGL
jgi:hypothetical protein